MRNAMKFRIAISALLFTAGTISYGQAIPAGGSAMSSGSAGPNLPTPDGVLHYALSASEIVQFGYYGPSETTYATVLSGNVAYTGKSTVHPFNSIVTGGIIFGNQSGQGTQYYTNGSVSQGLVTRNWVFNISDSISFLPQSPTTGISGIPGVGDLGAIPIQGPAQGPAGGILSTSGNRIGNTLGGSAERQIGHATSISGSGFWSALHYFDDNAGLDYSQVSGIVAVNQHLNARSSMSLDAVYSSYTYSGPAAGITTPDIETRGINVSYQRLVSRSLSISASVGPQWVSSSNSIQIPSALNVAATAGLSYQRGLTTAYVGYSRGVNGGSGVLPGALADSVYGSLAHTYGRKWVASMSVGYSHTSGLTQVPSGITSVPTNQVYDTVFGGVQVTRAFTPHFSGYASYGVQNQSNNFFLPSQNALSGTSQTFGIGVTYTPRSTRLGQF